MKILILYIIYIVNILKVCVMKDIIFVIYLNYQ